MKNTQTELINKIIDLNKQYEKSDNSEVFKGILLDFAEKYKEFNAIDSIVSNYGDKIIEDGNYDVGISIIKYVYENFKNITDDVTVGIRMAEYYIENGEIDKGTDILINICKRTSNYEEAFEYRNLTPLWNKYCHLVENKVPKSIDLSDDDDCVESLNEWEKVVYYTDELIAEVNSGGFSHYLYYCGNHFNEMKNSIITIGAKKVLALLDSVEKKFPKGNIPAKLETIQDKIDYMEDKGIDFEDEDDIYYDAAEKELLKKLHKYKKDNEGRFS